MLEREIERLRLDPKRKRMAIRNIAEAVAEPGSVLLRKTRRAVRLKSRTSLKEKDSIQDFEAKFRLPLLAALITMNGEEVPGQFVDERFKVAVEYPESTVLTESAEVALGTLVEAGHISARELFVLMRSTVRSMDPSTVVNFVSAKLASIPPAAAAELRMPQGSVMAETVTAGPRFKTYSTGNRSR